MSAARLHLAVDARLAHHAPQLEAAAIVHERVHGARQRRLPQLEAVRVAHRVAAMAARDRPPGKPAQRRTLHAEVRGHDLSELGGARRGWR